MSSYSNIHKYNNRNRNNHNAHPNRGRRRRSSSAVVSTVKQALTRKKQKKSSAHQRRDSQERSHPLVQKRLKAFQNQSLLEEGNGKACCQVGSKLIGAESSTVKRYLGTLYLHILPKTVRCSTYWHWMVIHGCNIGIR